jgi:hypothetical protein
MAYIFYGPFACPDTTPCGCDGVTDPCGTPCQTHYPSDYLCYSGPNLPGTGIQTYDTLTVALQKIDNQILLLKFGTTTSTTSTTTTHL